MNVLKIDKQIDRELIYTNHAIERAEQRKVPMPKYVPFGVRCSRIDVSEKGYKYYTLNFDFFGRLYEMVVNEENVVLTMFTPDFQPATQKEILDERRNMRQQFKTMIRPTKPKPIKYSHLEIQKGIEEYFNYA
jgi:hypothetical protein